MAVPFMFNRPDLAKRMAEVALGIDPLGGSSGLFLAAPRRTGKSTFLTVDLLPELRRRGAVPVYARPVVGPDARPRCDHPQGGQNRPARHGGRPERRDEEVRTHPGRLQATCISPRSEAIVGRSIEAADRSRALDSTFCDTTERQPWKRYSPDGPAGQAVQAYGTITRSECARMFKLSRDDMRSALEELGMRAVEAGKIIDLCVYGGSCLMMVSNFRDASQDIDAVAITDQAFVDSTSAEIAERRGWPIDWLNDGVRTYLSPNVDEIEDHSLSATYPSEEEPRIAGLYPDGRIHACYEADVDADRRTWRRAGPRRHHQSDAGRRYPRQSRADNHGVEILP